MHKLIAQLKNQPEAARKKIFIVCMTGFFAAVFMLYLFSIKNSIAYSLDKKASAVGEGLPGEFRLPGLKESITAAVTDALKMIRNTSTKQ